MRSSNYGFGLSRVEIGWLASFEQDVRERCNEIHVGGLVHLNPLAVRTIVVSSLLVNDETRMQRLFLRILWCFVNVWFPTSAIPAAPQVLQYSVLTTTTTYSIPYRRLTYRIQSLRLLSLTKQRTMGHAQLF